MTETIADIICRLEERMSPEDKHFSEWFMKNRLRLGEACAELGVECPPRGTMFIKLLQMRVKPLLR